MICGKQDLTKSRSLLFFKSLDYDLTSILKGFFMLRNLLKISFVSLIVIASGCAKYKPHPLSQPCTPEEIKCDKSEMVTLNDDLNEIVEMDDEDHRRNPKNKMDLTVVAHVLGEGDCRYYFSRKIVSKGYKPVQLYIKNNGNKNYILNASSINLPIEYRDRVADKLHLDAVPRVLGWGVAGLFCWPFLIPAAVECFKVPKANKALDEDFDHKVIDINSKYEIKPGATFNKVFFVREDEFDTKLKLSLVSTKTYEARSFGVTL